MLHYDRSCTRCIGEAFAAVIFEDRAYCRASLRRDMRLAFRQMMPNRSRWLNRLDIEILIAIGRLKAAFAWPT